MRNTLLRAIGALALAGAIAAPAYAGPKDWAAGKDRDAAQAPDISKHSVLTIPHNATFPLTKKVAMGNGKSFLVQFPFELKDVLVADPNKVDAVVQSADRVFLIAKKAGQTNAFFFDANGQQVLTLEVTVGADLSSLDALLKRLIPVRTSRSRWPARRWCWSDRCARRSTAIARPTSPRSSPRPTPSSISAVNGGGGALRSRAARARVEAASTPAS